MMRAERFTVLVRTRPCGGERRGRGGGRGGGAAVSGRGWRLAVALAMAACCAAAGWAAYAIALQRYQAGLGNLSELEDARRTALTAQQALLALRRERLAAWIALYRAAGGGWSAAADDSLNTANPGPRQP